MDPNMSVVQKIKELKAADSLNTESLLEFKTIGRPQPTLEIRQTSKYKTKEFHRNFRNVMYDLSSWICGCDATNAFYCYVCLFFSDDVLWCRNGIADLKHLKDKVRKHSLSADHMKNSVNYSAIGRIDIRLQLDSTYRKSIKDYNDNVAKNRYLLNKIIDCIKFCGAFELALRGHDDGTKSSGNPGVFLGLIDFVTELDGIFKTHLEESTVFKDIYKTIQNDLLDSILAVAQEQIKSEVQSADYIAIQVDETTDSSNKTQLIFIIRYVLQANVYERFLKFVNPPGTTADQLTNVILKELELLGIDKTPEKLIAQSYDEASKKSGKFGSVKAKIKIEYPAANFIHCYAHQLHLILQKAANQDKGIKIFFANLHGFSTFFRNPKRTAILEECVRARLPSAVPARWYFNTSCVETVFLYQRDLLSCLEIIIESEEDAKTINQAVGLKTRLKNEHFLHWLNFFYLIMPNCETLFEQLQERRVDIIPVENHMASFKSSIVKIKNAILNKAPFYTPTASSITPKKRKNEDRKRTVSIAVCDIIISEIDQRFDFSDHLIISQLFFNGSFEKYHQDFPKEILKLIKKDFPFINSNKLKTELAVIYGREDFRGSAGAIPMLQLFLNNNLNETFTETVKLLNILCTLPMTTIERERCFFTLKRIKTFLRNTVGQERLSALAMLSIEKSFIKNIVNFNERVIEHFANTKDRNIDLKCKNV